MFLNSHYMNTTCQLYSRQLIFFSARNKKLRLLTYFQVFTFFYISFWHASTLCTNYGRTYTFACPVAAVNRSASGIDFLSKCCCKHRITWKNYSAVAESKLALLTYSFEVIVLYSSIEILLLLHYSIHTPLHLFDSYSLYILYLTR